MKKIIGIFILIASLLLLSVIFRQSSKKNPQALEKVSVVFPTVAQIEWAPFYTAMSNGYFRDEGLQVDIQYSTKGTMAAYELLESNQVQFMYSSTENVFIAYEKGLDVVATYLLEPVNLMYIISDVKYNIHKPDDLVGKKIGMFSTTGLNSITLKRLLKSADVPLEKVETVPAGPALMPAFLEDKFEAALVFLNQKMLLENEGRQLHILAAEDYGGGSKAHIVVKREYLKEKSARVKKFLKALERGIEYSATHPEEAVDIYNTYNPDDANKKNINLKIWQEMIAVFKYKDKGHFSARENSEDWQNMQNALYDLKEISEKRDTSRMFTNDHLPSQ